jgi:hypothetical protein
MVDIERFEKLLSAVNHLGVRPDQGKEIFDIRMGKILLKGLFIKTKSMA